MKHREHVADTRLRENAGDHLLARLRCRHDMINRRRGLILQCVGVNPLPLPGYAGFPFPRLIEIFKRRVDRSRDIRDDLPCDAARLLGANHAAGPNHQ